MLEVINHITLWLRKGRKRRNERLRRGTKNTRYEENIIIEIDSNFRLSYFREKKKEKKKRKKDKRKESGDDGQR